MLEKNKILDPNFLIDDNNEISLRPKFLDEFIGQDKLKENLSIFIRAAKNRKEPLDHILFYGPPGLGKTTLSNIIAKEMGTNIKSTTGPVLEKVGDIAAILTDLSDGDIFFIDEIHRINRIVEETLYSVMEDFKLDIIIGQGPSAKNIKLDIPKFTLIGATTRAGLLTSPMRDRFGILHHLDFYSDENIKIILKRSANILNIKINDEGAEEIAFRSRGTPRIANRILKRIRDFAEVKNNGLIDKNIVIIASEMLEIDSLGLDKLDRKILLSMIENYNGGPCGIETLSIITGEEIDTITDISESFLIKKGLLIRTSRGRIVTDKAYEHLNIKKIHKKDNIKRMDMIYLNETNFYEEIKNGFVVVDFFAEWCSPCKMIAPIFEELSNEYNDKCKFFKINIDESKKIALDFMVINIPSILIFRDGEKIASQVGFVSKDDLKKFIDKNINM